MVAMCLRMFLDVVSAMRAGAGAVWPGVLVSSGWRCDGRWRAILVGLCRFRGQGARVAPLTQNRPGARH